MLLIEVPPVFVCVCVCVPLPAEPSCSPLELKHSLERSLAPLLCNDSPTLVEEEEVHDV